MDKNKLKTLLIPSDITVKQSMQRLNETAVKILFVTDGQGRLIGTVTDGDIRRGIINGRQLSAPIHEIMTKRFMSINEGDHNLQEKARELMKRNLIEHIPVVNGSGFVIDVVSWVDYLETESEEHEQPLLQNPVVIMAGGKGTRLDPFTKILPKPLIPIGDKPIIEHIMDYFHKNGFFRFILILNYKKEMIKMYFNENKPPYELEYVDEADYFGTAGGLSLLKDRLNDTFIVTNCDTILKGDHRDFFNWHRERRNMLTIVGSHREVTVPYGVLNMSNGLLSGIDEKPKFDLFINTGTYVFEPDVLNLIDKNEHIDMDKLITKAKAVYQDKVGVYPCWGGWFDIGQWDEYRKTMKYMGEQGEDV
jgi:dTDP-glucose pyrophosphorylase